LKDVRPNEMLMAAQVNRQFLIRDGIANCPLGHAGRAI
jgi:hypothetical protein